VPYGYAAKWFRRYTMRAQVILLAVVFGLVPALDAQHSAEIPAVELKINTRVLLPPSEPAMPIGGVSCDREGNVYARLLTPNASKERGGVFRLPIQEITPDGAVAKTFRITDISAAAVAGKHIFVSSDGNVYQLAVMGEGIYAVEFAGDGSVRAKTKLQGDAASIQPWDLAVFNTGGYLLTGEAGKDGRTPYTAVFDANGRFVRSVYEPEDEDARRKAESGDAMFAPSDRGNRFVSLGAVAVASDGNVYLLRHTSPTLVYVISPKGEVVRKLHIDAVGPDSVARSIESYGGRLAIGFDGSPTSVAVTDLTGALIARYTVDDDNHLDLACYSSQDLMFIAAHTGGRSYLVKARLP
jgi:hypothetical protein